MQDDVTKVARVLCCNAGQDPDALTPKPRGQIGLIPKWQNFTHTATAAMRETRLIDAEAALAVADGVNPETIKVRGWKLFADWLKGRSNDA